MTEFERAVRCERCRRGWRVVGASANPSNETQGELSFPCACGARVSVMLPGSANRDLVRIEPERSSPPTDR